MATVHGRHARAGGEGAIGGGPDRLMLQIDWVRRYFGISEQCGHSGGSNTYYRSGWRAPPPERGRARGDEQRRAPTRPDTVTPRAKDCASVEIGCAALTRRRTERRIPCRVGRSGRRCPADGYARRSTTRRRNPFHEGDPAVDVDTVIRHLPLTSLRWSTGARIAPSIIRNPSIGVRQSVAQVFDGAPLGGNLAARSARTTRHANRFRRRTGQAGRRPAVAPANRVVPPYRQLWRRM